MPLTGGGRLSHEGGEDRPGSAAAILMQGGRRHNAAPPQAGAPQGTPARGAKRTPAVERAERHGWISGTSNAIFQRILGGQCERSRLHRFAPYEVISHEKAPR